MLNLIIFGPPGSGKGTQSARIVQKYGVRHISTGDILREEMSKGTALGAEIARFIDHGMLVPDDIVIKELKHEVERHCLKGGIIFDGFPRTLHQAMMLDEMLEEECYPIDLVISVEVTEQELFSRLMGRSEDSGRSDDSEQIIWKRIQIYKDLSLPLVSYYKKQGKLVRVHGMDPVDKVFRKITMAIDTYLQKKEVLTEIQ